MTSCTGQILSSRPYVALHGQFAIARRIKCPCRGLYRRSYRRYPSIKSDRKLLTVLRRRVRQLRRQLGTRILRFEFWRTSTLHLLHSRSSLFESLFNIVAKVCLRIGSDFVGRFERFLLSNLILQIWLFLDSTFELLEFPTCLGEFLRGLLNFGVCLS